MVNKQKIWFLTLFSLILILSVYYITMPSELLNTSSINKDSKDSNSNVKVTIDETDSLALLEVEKDEERASKAAEYNSILTNNDSSVEEKNNAYEGLKEIDSIKSKEENIKKKIKDNLKLDVFVKINGNSINVIVKKENHDYSLANDIMRCVQEEFKDKIYISVKFQK